MLGSYVKEIFQQHISDILIFLCILHLGTVMVSFFIKWVHPYLESYVAMFNKNNGKKFDNDCSKSNVAKKYKKKDCVNPYCCSDTDSNEEFLKTSNLLKSTDDQLYVNRKDYCKNILKEIMLGIENNNGLNRFVIGQIQYQKRSSSEAQTNITIHPTIRLDYSCPNVFFSDLTTEKPLQSSQSSDYFESASSGSSDVDFYETEYVPILRHSGFCDFLKQKSSHQSSQTKRLNKSSKIGCQRSFYVETDLVSSVISEGYRKNVSQENKLLESAIIEFEKELKPIREQIQVLKDCLKGFDYYKTEQSSLSEFSSSISGTVLQSEGFSGTLSTVFTANVYDNISSHHGFQEKHLTNQTETNPNNTNSHVTKIGATNDLKSNGKNCTSEPQTKQPELNKTKRLSPLAEMYIKLSQGNSKSSCFLINSGGQKAHILDSENVTCHILLNVNVGDVSMTSNHKNHSVKERNIKPLLSEPEDILGKFSSTHVSLRPAK